MGGANGSYAPIGRVDGTRHRDARRGTARGGMIRNKQVAGHCVGGHNGKGGGEAWRGEKIRVLFGPNSGASFYSTHTHTHTYPPVVAVT